MRFNQWLENIAVYEAGKPIEEVVRKFGIKEEDIIKLASNENPYGSSPKVIESIKQNSTKASVYPDDSMLDLKNALATKMNISVENLIIGAGSDQIIEFCLAAKINPQSKILIARTTFAMYEIYAKHFGTEVIKTPSHQHNLQEFLQYYHQYKPDVIFLCAPNNPIGECLDSADIVDFITQINNDTLVVIDGAYQEFAAHKDVKKKIEPNTLIQSFSNVLYLGTFSKAYGLGGMRVGYGISSQEIIQALYKVRPPFNITTLSLVAAIAALQDHAFALQGIENNFKQMRHYEEFAQEMDIEFIPSYTNFITFVLKEPHDSTLICEYLLQKGVIIRNLKSYGMNAVRITIGTQEQNLKVLRLLRDIFEARG